MVDYLVSPLELCEATATIRGNLSVQVSKSWIRSKRLRDAQAVDLVYVLQSHSVSTRMECGADAPAFSVNTRSNAPLRPYLVAGRWSLIRWWYDVRRSGRVA